MRKYFIFFILLGQNLLIFTCLAEINSLLSFDDYVEKIYQRQNFTEEEDFESIREALQEAYAAPLDLNKITQESLVSFGILYENQINNYFNHIAATGPLYSKYELQAILDFDLATIELLLPFVYVVESYRISSQSLWQRIAKNGTNHVLFRYEPSLGSIDSEKPLCPKPDSLPLGDLNKCTTQLSLKHNNDISLGITARKQAGESFSWDHSTHRYGFNTWSIFLAVEQRKYFKRMLIGDYQVGYGQGILFSTGFQIQNGADIVSIFRSNNMGIRPYKGIRRIGLRGIAITSVWGPMELTGFYATNNLDAKIELDDENRPYTRRIDPTGKYHTMDNLKKKGRVNEQVVGCTVLTRNHKNQREVGINMLCNYYDIPIIPKVSNFSHYLFEGQRAVATSLFYRWLWKNVLLFGEIGFTFPNSTIIHKHHEKALISGLIISLSHYLDLSTALYYYGKGFYSPYSSGFKHYTTDNTNEKGVYGGVKFTPFFNWQLSTHGHFFSTLRPKPQLAVVGNGHSITIRSSYTLHRITTFVVQHKFNKTPKNKSKKERDTIEKDTEKIATATRNNIKLKIDHKFTHHWWMGLEGQYTHHTFLDNLNHGYALSNTQKWKGNKFQFSSRITYFSAQNYVARLYFHEPSSLYSGTRFNPYYGDGIAASCLVCWKPIRLVRLELKYSFVYALKKLVQTEDMKRNKKASIKNRQAGAIQLELSF